MQQSAESDALAARLSHVQQQIDAACRRAGRPNVSVTLVAVTKGVPVDEIRRAIEIGVRDIGENRVQEARAKREALPGGDARWHLIGHLQRNKINAALEIFDTIQSIDTPELAAALDAHAASRGRVVPAFIEVNVSGEATKFGCAPERARALAELVDGARGLRLAGFMTIAPFADDPEAGRPHFRALRALRDDVARALSRPASELRLSMGMSHDFEVAIEEGADLVRIGTALFGPRATVDDK